MALSASVGWEIRNCGLPVCPHNISGAAFQSWHSCVSRQRDQWHFFRHLSSILPLPRDDSPAWSCFFSSSMLTSIRGPLTPERSSELDANLTHPISEYPGLRATLLRPEPVAFPLVGTKKVLAGFGAAGGGMRLVVGSFFSLMSSQMLVTGVECSSGSSG